jgi:hypothetical protein
MSIKSDSIASHPSSNSANDGVAASSAIALHSLAIAAASAQPAPAPAANGKSSYANVRKSKEILILCPHHRQYSCFDVLCFFLSESAGIHFIY